MATKEIGVTSDQMTALSKALDSQFDRVNELTMPEDPGTDALGFAFLSEAFSAFRSDADERRLDTLQWCADTGDGVTNTAVDAQHTDEEVATWFRTDQWNQYGYSQ